ncbi:MAG: magnesium transporter, partial [Bacteroidaceae bacterium]|nr:magnesium transporter [Bacteroidaceae bacterium]
LPKDMSADVFSYMTSESKQSLIESIGDNEIRSLINEMFLDDTVDFLEELPAGVVKRVLQNTDAKTRDLINQFLQYPENSAGSIMTIEYMEARVGMTAGQVMADIRRVGFDKETIYTIYVIDEGRHLKGSVALRKLILYNESVVIDSVMETNVASVTTTDDQEKVAGVVRRYDLMAIPVVDKENRLVGIITADDIMDVIQEENTEDFEKMAALTPSEDSYLHTSPWKLAINRIPWLILLSIVAIFTGMIITSYEDLLKNVDIVLTACIPMLMDTGGNCGAQVSTLIIRGLALNELQPKDILRIQLYHAEGGHGQGDDTSVQ